jgi:hypothetical protein
MKVAVIGSGFYGTAIALELKSKGLEVDLYESQPTLMQGASAVNQYRYHLGYHYPRSIKTVKEIFKSHKYSGKFFKNFFSITKNYYGVAKKNSKISFIKYKNFLEKNNLGYKIINNNISKNEVSDFILTTEKVLNYFKYKNYIKFLLKKKGVRVFYNTIISKFFFISRYEKIIICAYNNNNQILNRFSIKPEEKFKYELVEKLVISLPSEYRRQSYVILDGNFVNVDPYLGTSFHLLSHVKLSKLEVIKDYYPNFKNKNKVYINKGLVNNFKNSNFTEIIKDAKQYLPFLEKSKYVGSLYAVRTLKMNKERTDERTTQVKIFNNKFYAVFSSKWNGCWLVAKKIYSMIT